MGVPEKINEIANRIAGSGDPSNLSSLNTRGAVSFGEKAVEELHKSLLRKAEFASGQNKISDRNLGFKPEVEDYMAVMLKTALDELKKLTRKY